MKLSRCLALSAGLVIGSICGTAAAAVHLSATAHVQLVFTKVKEVPIGAPAGRAGLKYQTGLSGFGFSGGSAEDADSDANIDLGFLGGFPDGNAPLVGSGAYISFNPFASCSLPGDAFGIGSLYFEMAMTDRTQGSSRWEITCEITSWVKVEATFEGLDPQISYWSATAGFDLTDSNTAFDETLITRGGVRPDTSHVYYGPIRVVTLVIAGSPDQDPAQGVVNLRAEAESAVQLGPEAQDVTMDAIFGYDHAWDLSRK